MIELLSGPLAEHLDVLAYADPAALDQADLAALIGSLDRLRSRVQGLQDRALVAWDRLTMPAVGDSDAARLNHRWASDELGLVLGVSSPSASARVIRAVTLAQKLPETAADLAAGLIGTGHAERLAAAARNVAVSVARAAEEITRADPDWRTPQQLERVFTAAVMRVDPEGAAGRSRRARRDRQVRVRVEPDGMASLWALLPAVDAHAVHAAVDAHARSSQATNRLGDDRTLAERRADALVDLVCATGGAGAHGSGKGGSGRRVHVHVTVAWSTLIGADDAPADLTGHGPIDAATARRIAADPTATWRRLLVDPVSGRLLDYGRTTYRPPADLADFVTARDAVCRFPGCEQPAAVCDLDHRTPYGTPGGVTAPANLDPLCRHHHRLKHEGGWAHTRDPDTGDSIWTSPGGQQYGRPAHVLPTGRPVEPPAPPPGSGTETKTDTEPEPRPDPPPF